MACSLEITGCSPGAAGGTAQGDATMKPPALLCLLLIVLMPAPAVAHKPSDSYLSLSVENETVRGQWDIALRDLDHAVSLDLNDDGMITWGELQARHSAIA